MRARGWVGVQSPHPPLSSSGARRTREEFALLRTGSASVAWQPAQVEHGLAGRGPTATCRAGCVPRVERAKGPRRGVYRPKLTGRLTALTSAPAAPNAERAVTARRSGIGRRVPERRFDFTLRAAGVVARVHIFDVFFHTLDDFRNARPGRGSADPSRRHGRRGLKSVFRR
jgi:hypothetical protein